MAMQRNRLLFLGIVAAVATWILVDGIQNYLNDGSDRRKSGQPIGIASKDLSAGHRLVAADFDTEAAGTKSMERQLVIIRPRPQNDFGMPSTCVATWLRIRLVEIGATW